MLMGDDISFSGTVRLNADVTVSGGTSGTDDDIIFTSTVDSETAGTEHSLVAQDASGNIVIDGAVGSTNDLSGLTVSAGQNAEVGNIGVGGGTPAAGVITGNVSITAAGGFVTLDGSEYRVGGGGTFSSDSGASATVLSGAGPVNVVTADGDVSFQTNGIQVAGGVLLDVDTGGSGSGTGDIVVAGQIRSAGTDSRIDLNVGGASIDLQGQVGNADELLQVILGAATEGISLSGNVITSTSNPTAAPLNEIDITGELTISGNRVLKSGGNTADNGGANTSISTGAIRSTTDSGDDLTVDAGAGTVEVGQIGLGAGDDDVNAVTLYGDSGITLNGAVYTGIDGATNAGAVDINGPVTLGTDITIDSTDSGGTDPGSVDFSSTVDSSASPGYDLTVNAGGGTVSFNGIVGTDAGSDLMNGLTVTGGTINLGASVFTGEDGEATPNPGNVDLNGAVVLAADLTIDTTDNVATNPGSVDFSSVVDSNSTTAQQLTVNTGAGGGAINFNGAIGTSDALIRLEVQNGGVVRLDTTTTVGSGAAGGVDI